MAHFQLAVECVTAMSLLIVLTQNLVFIERNQYSVIGDMVIGFIIHFFVELCNPINLRDT